MCVDLLLREQIHKVNYSKTCSKRPFKKKTKNCFFQTDYCLMQVKSIAECSNGHSAMLSTYIKLPFVNKIFVLPIFE